MTKLELDPAVPEPLRSTYVTAGFAADYYGIHVESLRRHLRSGALPAFKIGKEWHIARADVLSWNPGQVGNPLWKQH